MEYEPWLIDISIKGGKFEHIQLTENMIETNNIYLSFILYHKQKLLFLVPFIVFPNCHKDTCSTSKEIKLDICLIAILQWNKTVLP